MNTLILEPSQFTSSDTALLSLRQQQHISSVLKLKQGDTLTVGKLGGKLGRAELLNHNTGLSLTNIVLDTEPPPNLDFIVILAMPRPQMLKRILQSVAIFGVAELILIQTNRVEKSFWQSPAATDQAIREQLILGLEQAKATQLPKVSKHLKFRNFIEDDCPEITTNYRKLIAHPGAYPLVPTNLREEKIAVAIGPEGGFTDFEVDLFMKSKFTPVQFGKRILKVELAITAFLGRLY